MANIIKGNVYIIDSAGVYLTGEVAGVTSAGHINGPFPDMSISSVMLYGSSSDAELAISYASANSIDIIHLRSTGALGGNESLGFSTPLSISDKLYVRTISAGTGYIYFS